MNRKTVTEILADVATEARDRLGSRPLVLRRYLPPFFPLAPPREFTGANQVAEQNYQVAPLAICGGAPFRRSAASGRAISRNFANGRG